MLLRLRPTLAPPLRYRNRLQTKERDVCRWLGYRALIHFRSSRCTPSRIAISQPAPRGARRARTDATKMDAFAPAVRHQVRRLLTAPFRDATSPLWKTSAWVATREKGALLWLCGK